MESSISQPAFDELPVMYQARIRDLQQELLDGDITQKGFNKKIGRIMEEYQATQAPAPTPVVSPAMHQQQQQHLQSSSASSRQVQFSEPSADSQANPAVASRPGASSVDYVTRKSTLLGFKKPGINFDDLLGEFDEVSDDSDDSELTGNISYRLQPDRTPLGISVDGLERTTGMKSPQTPTGVRDGTTSSSGKSTPRTRSGSRTPYNLGGRVVDDISGWTGDNDWAEKSPAGTTGGAFTVLHDIMDPLGSRATQMQQALDSDDSSVDEFDSIGPADFNPDQITRDAMNSSRAALGPATGSAERNGDASPALAEDVKRMNSLVYPRGGRGGRRAQEDGLRQQIAQQAEMMPQIGSPELPHPRDVRAQKTSSKLYDIGEAVDFGNMPSSDDEAPSRRDSEVMSGSRSPAVSVPMTVQSSRSLSSDKRDDSGIIQQQASPAGSGIPTPRPTSGVPQFANDVGPSTAASAATAVTANLDMQYSRMSIGSTGSESLGDGVGGSITLADLAHASNVDLTSIRDSMVIPDQQQEQPTLAQLAAESEQQAAEENVAASDVYLPALTTGGMVVVNGDSPRSSGVSSIAYGRDSTPSSAGLVVMNNSSTFDVGGSDENNSDAPDNDVTVSAMPRAFDEYAHESSAHGSFEDLAVAAGDPQPTLTVANRVGRKPTQTARLDRRPTTAGAGRMSYYSPETELEVPVNFDMPTTPVPAIDTSLAHSLTMRGTGNPGPSSAVVAGPMTAPVASGFDCMYDAVDSHQQQQLDDQFADIYGGGQYSGAYGGGAGMDGSVPLTLSAVGAVVEPRVVGDETQSPQLRQLMAQHVTLAGILQHRASTTPGGIAYTCIDTKGKEIGSWTWQGLHVRAMHVVQVLRQQGVAVWGDRVALVYRKYEMLEFVASLFGCFYAGLVAVPIVAGDSYAELVHVLNSTGAALVLTTELNIRSLNKDLSQNSVGPGWPSDVPWVRTDSLGGCVLSPAGVQAPSAQHHTRTPPDGSYSSSTETRIADLSASDIAYIEFSKSPNGELKGVQVTHGAAMTQCAGWMMSTGMLGIGRKYKHRVELEQSDDDDAAADLADPMHELDDHTPSPTVKPPLATVESAGNPVPDSPSHPAQGSLGKKWGGSTGFLGRLRNVGSLPKIRKSSRARGDSGASASSFRNSFASQSQFSPSSRDRASSATSGMGTGSPSTIPRNPTRMSMVSRSPVTVGSLSKASPRSSRLPGADSPPPAASSPGAADRATAEVVVSYIEPRQHFGLVFGILAGCYGGHQSVYTSSALCDIPGAYINLLTRYRATVAVGDYTGLQSVLSAATDEPAQIVDYNKKIPPNLATLRLILLDALFIDPVFHATFNRNVLHPYGCPYQSIADAEGHPVITPVCTLAEHGSVLMAMRDCLSNYPPPGVGKPAAQADGYEFVLDREAFKENRVVVLPDQRNESEVDRIGTVRFYSFGYPAFGSTIAVVDPETRELCAPDAIGELWIDSPALGTGFWGLPKLTSSIFAARYTYSLEPGVELVSAGAYLRTGLMGALVHGQVLVFGFYEDRIRTLTIGEGEPQDGWYVEPRLSFHYAGDINNTIRRYLPQITECTAFEMYANDAHFPVIAAEVRHNSGMYSTIADEVYGVLRNRHGLHAYAVALCPPNTLPRAFQYGKRTVNAQLCRHQFESGRINCLFVKLSTDNLFMNLPPPASQLPDDISQYEDPSVALYGRWIQQTSLEDAMPSIDERSRTDLSRFTSITDVLVWRAQSHPEEPALAHFDERGRAVKTLSFSKLLTKVSALAQLMLEKKRVAAGDHVLIAITPGPSYVTAIHACLAIGAIPIPVSPPDVNRLSEDMPPLLATIREFKITYMLVDAHSDEIFRSKMMEGAMRSTVLRALLGNANMPAILNVGRAPKSPKHMLGRGSFKFLSQWAEPKRPALVMQFTGAQASTPQYVTYSHKAILGFCSQQKGDFQMLATQPVIASVRAYNGYGLLHCTMIGVYVGCATLLLSPVDFFANPLVWFDLVQRYKVKDAFTTLPMLQHAMNFITAYASGRLQFSLHSVRNLILATEERVDPATYARIRDFFASARLDEMSINPLYGTLMNPCISTRAYLGVSPLTLRLDLHAMRRGKVVALPPITEMESPEEAELHSLTLQDSGKVSGSTMVAIVDPLTRQALPAGSIGEVWVCSHSNALRKQMLVPGGATAAGRPVMNGSNATGFLDGAKDYEFVRTNDLGFLYLQVTADNQDGAPAEPYLFVAGKISETFSVDEYMYFYSDIERAAEDTSIDIIPGGCVVLQTTVKTTFVPADAPSNASVAHVGSARSREISVDSTRLRLVAVLSLRKSPSESFLPNLACLVFNNVLDRHQVLLDEIVFVPRDSLPRSRISERRRRTVRGLYESGKLNAFVSYPISNSPTLPSGAANPNNRQSFLGPPNPTVSSLAFANIEN